MNRRRYDGARTTRTQRVSTEVPRTVKKQEHGERQTGQGEERTRPRRRGIVFDQLKNYLQAGASQAYIKHTVLRSIGLTNERRFQFYLNTIPASSEPQGTKQRYDLSEGTKPQLAGKRSTKACTAFGTCPQLNTKRGCVC